VAGLLPINILGELVSIGTLLAFFIVCIGVLFLRYRHPELPRAFKTPFVPFVPVAGAFVTLLQMIFLPGATWLRLGIWTVIGLVIYFGYSMRRSALHATEIGSAAVTPRSSCAGAVSPREPGQ
jgi:APA family basic amino acid/polyamine antiporter